MSRIVLLGWLCCGAFALGILVLAANRRQVYLSKLWYVTALVLGPIFLCFVLPLWFGKWGDKQGSNKQ